MFSSNFPVSVFKIIYFTPTFHIHHRTKNPPKSIKSHVQVTDNNLFYAETKHIFLMKNYFSNNHGNDKLLFFCNL